METHPGIAWLRGLNFENLARRILHSPHGPEHDATLETFPKLLVRGQIFDGQVFDGRNALS